MEPMDTDDSSTASTPAISTTSTSNINTVSTTTVSSSSAGAAVGTPTLLASPIRNCSIRLQRWGGQQQPPSMFVNGNSIYIPGQQQPIAVASRIPTSTTPATGPLLAYSNGNNIPGQLQQPRQPSASASVTQSNLPGQMTIPFATLLANSNLTQSHKDKIQQLIQQQRLTQQQLQTLQHHLIQASMHSSQGMGQQQQLGATGMPVPPANSSVLMPNPIQILSSSSAAQTSTSSVAQSSQANYLNSVINNSYIGQNYLAYMRQRQGLQSQLNGPTSSCSVPPSSIKKAVAVCPSPPNWERSCLSGLQALTPFLKIDLDSNTEEYKVISGLVTCAQVNSIQQVVNLDLWKKFTNKWKEIMFWKSDDLQLLSGLGFPEKELMERSHVVMNFDKHSSVAASEYSDNIALLFHCTRGKVHDVLTQGLDERLSMGGRLGRGIYFADDPHKSMSYDTGEGTIILFAVFLGDCMSVDHLPSASNHRSVREPEKAPHQRRSPTDLYFDSIVGRPAGVNEYVIYNRLQCCPLYLIKYNPTTKVAGKQSKICGKLPPFAWLPKNANQIPTKPTSSDILTQSTSAATPTPSTSSATPTPSTSSAAPTPSTSFATPTPSTSSGSGTSSTTDWPLFASTIFNQMNRRKDVLMAMAEIDAESEEIATKLSSILDLGIAGYTDDAKNLVLLQKFNFDLEKTTDHIMKQTELTYLGLASPPGTSKVDNLKMKFRKIDKEWTVLSSSSTNDDTEDCPICCNASSPGSWQTLQCTHKMCFDCYKKLEKKGVTMSDTEYTFVKCPFCQARTGIEIGTCPTGVRDVKIFSNYHCEGYETFGTIGIQYNINAGKYQLKRLGFLPNTPEGQKVLKLLEVAWDRRLCFSIGTSVTTGQQDTLVWNIHHKTSVTGGPPRYGYPDPTYLTRVQEELKQLGIE